MTAASDPSPPSSWSSLALAACAPAAPADGPGATVAEAIRLAGAKDVVGLRALACAGQEDEVRERLGPPDAVGEQLLPGLDVDALVTAVRLDVSGVVAGEPVIDGDVALGAGHRHGQGHLRRRAGEADPGPVPRVPGPGA